MKNTEIERTHGQSETMRGIRSDATKNRITSLHLTKINEERREYRKQGSETSRGEWRRLATKARQLAKQPPEKAFKDTWKENKYTYKFRKQNTHKNTHNETHQQHTAYARQNARTGHKQHDVEICRGNGNREREYKRNERSG